MNLRARVSLILVGLSVVVTVPAGLLMLRSMDQALRQAIGERLDDLARANAAGVGRFLEDSLGQTRQIALALDPAALASRDAAAVAETLGKLVRDFPRYQNGCFVLDREGVLWADYPAVAGTRGRTFVWREYFRRTVAEGRGVVSEPYRSARTAEPVVTFTAPLSDRDGRPDGLVGCSVQLGHPEALGGFQQARIGETGYLYVIDRSRLMVMHPERARLLVRDTAPGANRLLDRALAGFEGWGETLNSRGVPMLLALRSVGGTNWVLGAQQTQAEAYAPSRAARTTVAVGTAGAALLAIALGFALFHPMVRELTFLGAEARRIGERLAAEEPPGAGEEQAFAERLAARRRGDEIGDLAEALSQMRARLGAALRSLRESEERFRLAFRTSPDSININRLRDGLFVDVNEGFTALTGYAREEVIGRSSLEIGIWDDPADRRRLVEALTRDGVVRNLEARFRLKDGGVTTGLLSARVLALAGEPHILSIVRDIEELKQARERLRESEEKYRTLVQQAQEAIFIAEGGRIVFPNPATLALTGHTAEELAARPLLDLVHPDHRGRAEAFIDRLRAGEDPPRALQLPILARGRDELWLDLRVGRIAWMGQPAHLVMARDINEQRLLERQLRHAQKMEAMGTLAGGVAHDFNNILQGILGYTQLLLSREIDETTRATLEIVDKSADRAAALTRQLLTFSRSVEGRYVTCDLNAEIRRLQQVLERILPRIIRIETELALDLPGLWADPGQIEQVIMNLAINARDAMPEGGVLTLATARVSDEDVRSAGHSEVAAGSHVCLTVVDTGLGMGPEVLDRIFEPFFTMKERGRGTGLGLAITYGIVRGHDGHISCRSRVGGGTTFSVFLPAARLVESPAEPPAAAEGEAGGRGEAILVVDDEEVIRSLSVEMLGMSGYRPSAAPGGEEALRLLAAPDFHCDLVILDLSMPGIGGLACLRAIRELRPGLPVVVATGYAAEGVAEELRAAGAAAVLGKPLRVAELLAAARGAIDGRPSGG